MTIARNSQTAKFENTGFLYIVQRRCFAGMMKRHCVIAFIRTAVEYLHQSGKRLWAQFFLSICFPEPVRPEDLIETSWSRIEWQAQWLTSARHVKPGYLEGIYLYRLSMAKIQR